MAADYSNIIKQLNHLRTNCTDAKYNSERDANQAAQMAEKYENLAVTYDNKGEWKKAQECRDKKNQCFAEMKNLNSYIVNYKSLIDQCTTLITNIKNKSSEVVKEIDKLEEFIQKGHPKNECTEIRLIKNHLLLKIEKYRKILEFCKD